VIGVRVTVPVACFRKGLAREYLETEPLPPPSTCYGFLLSLVGETDRESHTGCRVAPEIVAAEGPSVVLRTVWRIKNKNSLPGTSNNKTPDYQQLLTGIDLVIWLDSSEEEKEGNTLESRVRASLWNPVEIERFGGLSLGESTHLVDEVSEFDASSEKRGQIFLQAEKGRLTLPVWVDHVGSAGTVYVTGDLREASAGPPPVDQMPRVRAP